MKEPCFWIVDDDELFLLLSTKLFTKNKITESFTTFINGAEASNELLRIYNQKSNPPCIIVLDLNMPICDGWCFLDKFEQLHAEFKERISIFICSSSIDPADKRKAASYSAVKEFVEKPLSLDKLMHMIACIRENDGSTNG
jgi:CheY-like chemotaxis protein